MYTALLATSQTLADFIQKELENDPTLRTFFNSGLGGTMVVALKNPEEMSENHEQGLSLWLYRITRDEDRLNDPPQQLSPGLFRDPPLPLRLHYLYTPVVDPATPNNAEIEQRVLGKVLQSLYGHPLLRGTDLSGDLSGTDAEVRVRLEPMSLEDITRIWNALERPYQLSISYETTLVNIDSEIFDRITPVGEVIADYGVILEER
jgi:Pvc16 N-terminal domain